MDLDNIDKIRPALKGCDTLYFTFWMRYNSYLGTQRGDAVKKATNLIDAVYNTKIHLILKFFKIIFKMINLIY